jgi:hypothetical protein
MTKIELLKAAKSVNVGSEQVTKVLTRIKTQARQPVKKSNVVQSRAA